MKKLVYVATLVIATGCGTENKQAANEKGDELAKVAEQAKGTATTEHDNDPPKADNTAKNERDTEHDSVTPGDQGENATDLAITQAARQAVVAEDSLSMGAKNAKIITVGGVVTLRGPVESADEKKKIEALARQAAGVKRIDNQLEVTK